MGSESIVQDSSTGGRAAGWTWSKGVACLAIFLIAHEENISVRQCEGCHSIHGFRRWKAVVHRVSLVGNDAILKSFWQREIFARRSKRTVAVGLPAALRVAGECGTRDEGVEYATTERTCSGCHCRTCEELSSIQIGSMLLHGLPSIRRSNFREGWTRGATDY
jgi:hypothetical protein